MKNRIILWSVGYALMLVCFTVYILLDTFVIPRDIAVAERENSIVFPVQEESAFQELTPSPAAGSSNEATTPKMNYQDENICISIESLRYCDTNVYLADVTLTSARYLKTAFAEGTYGRNITASTSEIAAQCNAILAVNGDYYGARTTGYVIRNGNLYRSEPSDREMLAIYPDGSFEIIVENETSPETLLEKAVYQAFSFGPGLVADGAVSINPQYEVGKFATENPRTAIGEISPLHYVFVVTDGRSEDSRGLTIRELADLMVELGVQCAYSLDGGGSSTLYFNGTVINAPGTIKKQASERKVSDIVYIG